MPQVHSVPLSSKGFPLFMLHGWGNSSENLRSLGKLLSNKRAVTLFDLPGFGRSPPPPAVWNSFDYAEAIAHQMEEQGVEQCDLFGHSFGGKVALSFALRYPERVRKLILAAPSGVPPKHPLTKKFKFLGIKVLGKCIQLTGNKWGVREWFRSRFGSTDYRNAQGVMRSILVRSVNEDLTPQLPNVKAETLLLFGGRDRDIPEEIGRRMEKRIPGSQLLFLPHHGHQPFLDVGSHLIARHTLSFLKKGEA